MNLYKLIYEIREKIPAISDDRDIDDRLITHTIDTVRAEALRNVINNRPGTDLLGASQNITIDLLPVSRSVIPELPLNCEVLRSVNKIPDLINSGVLLNAYQVRTADVLHLRLSKVDPLRVGYLTPNNQIVYVFLNYDRYLYVLSAKDFTLTKLVFTGVFESPLEADPDLEDYPIKASLWNSIKPNVIADLLPRLPQDPINNSEPDWGSQTPQKDD